jgi:hypothetical protein
MTKLYHIRFMRDKDFRVETSPNGPMDYYHNAKAERRRLFDTGVEAVWIETVVQGAVCRVGNVLWKPK